MRKAGTLTLQNYAVCLIKEEERRRAALMAEERIRLEQERQRMEETSAAANGGVVNGEVEQPAQGGAVDGQQPQGTDGQTEDGMATDNMAPNQQVCFKAGPFSTNIEMGSLPLLPSFLLWGDNKTKIHK